MTVTKDDFEKIWASTSPLTPYQFSESQYKEGWNFVGGTPPSRQMWDAFMQGADEKLKYLYQHEDVPVGFEYFTMNPNIPQGSLPLIGGEYSRETYADLWSWVQEQTGYLKTESEWQALSTSNNGNVPYYSDGDGSTTFRVPSLHCWIKGSDGSVQLVGSYLEAGLPNITGGGQATAWQDISYSGSFVSTKEGATANTGYAADNNYFNFDFDASRSSSVYGNANTVQPESIVGMWLVKAYGVIVDTGTIDEQAYIDDRYNAMKTYVDNTFPTKTYVDGKFESVVASGENYVRYDSGIQVCFGTTDDVSVPTSTDTSKIVTFPVPFIDNKYTINFITEFVVNSSGWRHNSLCVSSKTTTQAYLYVYISNDSYTCKLDWVAIGRWK